MDSRLVTLQIRKLRKKLRQIEHLESLERDLEDEEIKKCLKKDDLRDELLLLLPQVSQEENKPSKVDEDFNSSCSVNTDWSVSTTKSASGSDVNVTVSQTSKLENPAKTVQNSDLPVKVQDEKQDVTGKGDSEQVKVSTVTQSKNPSDRKVEAVITKSQSSPSKKSKSTNQVKDTVLKGNSKLDFWNTSGFIVNVLEGHNDIVTAVDCNGPWFVSASRDTTIKVWDFKTLTEQRSLGSHTGSVTDVFLISVKELGSLGPKLDLSEDDFLVLSGSVDCSLKLWSATTGELLKSIYTYNPITKVTFYPELSCAVTASDGGKLELWDLETKDNIISHKAHEESITGLVVKEGKIFTSCAVDGEVKVFEMRDNGLFCVFVSENIRQLDGKPVVLRHVRALSVKGDNLYYGDDGVNLKTLAWKQGLVKKIPNHKEDYGMTDAICISDSVMITSAFDLDTGHGYLNAFDVTNEPSYLTTINNEDSGRILDIACCSWNGKYITIVTAGTELLVWRQVPKSSDNPECIPAKFEQVLSKPPVDSDLESDVEFSESDSEEGPSGSRRGSTQSNRNSSWIWGCNLL